MGFFFKLGARVRRTVTLVSSLSAGQKRMSNDPTHDSTDPDEEVEDSGDAQQDLKGEGSSCPSKLTEWRIYKI